MNKEKNYLVKYYLGLFQEEFECRNYIIHANAVEFTGCGEDGHTIVIPMCKFYIHKINSDK
ncbi:hypothetical protein [Sporosalibacterium faouarense]|uniref:hypothetical protein n=1 Tax=Sporosalibacterium faouarense TaxID=516123 RepID=UPI00192B03AC|nr:hypothetical protein [Sporosalibacterium faouarense]